MQTTITRSNKIAVLVSMLFTACMTDSGITTQLTLELPHGAAADTALDVVLNVNGAPLTVEPFSSNTRVLSATVPLGASITLNISYLHASNTGFVEYRATDTFVVNAEDPVLEPQFNTTPSRDMTIIRGFDDGLSRFDNDVPIALNVRDMRSNVSQVYNDRLLITLPEGRRFEISATNPRTNAEGRAEVQADDTAGDVYLALGALPALEKTPPDAPVMQNGLGFTEAAFLPVEGYAIECALGDDCNNTALSYTACADLQVAATLETGYPVVVRYTDISAQCVETAFTLDRTPPSLSLSLSTTLLQLSPNPEPVNLRISENTPSDILDITSLTLEGSAAGVNLCPNPSVNATTNSITCTDVFSTQTLVAGQTQLTLSVSDIAGNAFTGSVFLTVINAIDAGELVAGGMEMYRRNAPAGSGIVYLGLPVRNLTNNICNITFEGYTYYGFNESPYTPGDASTISTALSPLRTSSIWFPYYNFLQMNEDTITVDISYSYTCGNRVSKQDTFLNVVVPLRKQPVRWLSKPNIHLPLYDAEGFTIADLAVSGGDYFNSEPQQDFDFADPAVIRTEVSRFYPVGTQPQQGDELKLNDINSTDFTTPTLHPGASLVTWSDDAVLEFDEFGTSTTLGQTDVNIGKPVQLLWRAQDDLIILVGDTGWQVFDPAQASSEVFPLPCGNALNGDRIIDATLTGVAPVNDTNSARIAMLVRTDTALRHCEVAPLTAPPLRDAVLDEATCPLQAFSSNELGGTFTAFGGLTTGCALTYDFSPGSNTATIIRTATGGGSTVEKVYADDLSRFGVVITADYMGSVGTGWLMGDTLRPGSGNPVALGNLHVGFAPDTGRVWAINFDATLQTLNFHTGDLSTRASGLSFIRSWYLSDVDALITGAQPPNAVAATAATYDGNRRRQFISFSLNDGAQILVKSGTRKGDISPSLFARMDNAPVHHMLVRGPQLAALSQFVVAPLEIQTVLGKGFGNDPEVIVNGIKAEVRGSSAHHVDFVIPQALGALGTTVNYRVRVLSNGRLSAALLPSINTARSVIDPEPTWKSLGFSSASGGDCTNQTDDACASLSIQYINDRYVAQGVGLVGIDLATVGMANVPPTTDATGRWLLAPSSGQWFSHPLTTPTSNEGRAPLFKLPGTSYARTVASDTAGNFVALGLSDKGVTPQVRFYRQFSLSRAATPDMSYPTLVGPISALAFSKTSDAIIAADIYGNIALGFVGMTQAVAANITDEGSCPSSGIGAVALSPHGPADSMTLLSAAGNIVGLWTLNILSTGIEQRCIGSYDAGSAILSIALSENGRVAAVGSSNKTLALIHNLPGLPLSDLETSLPDIPLRLAFGNTGSGENITVLMSKTATTTYELQPFPFQR